MRRIGLPLLAATLVLCFSGAATFAATVHVSFASGESEILTLNRTVSFYSNHKEPAEGIPDEIDGLRFTRRKNAISCDATVTADGQAIVYVIVEAEGGRHRPLPVLDALANDGWTRLDAPAFGIVSHRKLAAFKRTISAGGKLHLIHGPPSGFCVAAKDLVVDSEQSGGGGSKDKPPAKEDENDRFRSDPALSLKPIFGPTTRVSQVQTSINGLVVYHLEHGVMVGKTMRTILTVLPGDSPTAVNFRFVSAVGPAMRSCRDDAVRYVHVRFPNWNASSAEMTFEERDEKPDGGSIGAVLSTLMLSAIEGFKIDRNVAVTGDVAADGTLLRIGGVSAKVHGAEDSDCTMVVMPADNYGQLVNTESFIAEGKVPKVQVIGAQTVDDVIAAVRTDRNDKLTKAMELYGQVQQSIGSSKTYLHSPECAAKLTQILALVPEHLSAKLLWVEATGKRPKTLSAGASQYYIYAAVNQIMPFLTERPKEGGQVPPSAIVHQGLENLQKLRAICDPNFIPVVDAWERFIRTLSSYEAGLASSRGLEAERQAVIDAMAKVDMNADLMQSMIKEGI